MSESDLMGDFPQKKRFARGSSQNASTFVTKTIAATNKYDSDMRAVWESREKPLKNSLKKSDQKEVSVVFRRNLNEVVETEERRDKKSRPKSANYFDTFEKDDSRKRPSSSEPVLEDLGENRQQKNVKVYHHVRECCCCCHCRDSLRECSSLLDFESGVRPLPEDCWNLRCQPRRKCVSISNFSKTNLQKFEKIFSEKDVNKVKRSLRLLGFELSEFGICSDGADDPSRGWKPRQRLSAFSTKVTNRSISLDSLREDVRRAWANDRLDESHRRVLARAAYEEWYFRKERELWEKREEERMMRLKAEENFRIDFQRKKEKSEEEFRKWLQRKRTKRKEREENLHQKQGTFSRLKKSEEESEKAFIKWKKSKEKELLQRRIEKSMEEERKKESERLKHEKKIIAEKAFQQWKSNIEHTEKLLESKRRQQKKKQEIEERKRREEGRQISFEMWKAAKDEQIKQRIKQIRTAERIAREARLAQMEEKMYEAEQAFEDWLERVDLRRQQRCCNEGACQKNIPWIPS